MPSVKDVVIVTPSEQQRDTCKAWPIWKSEPKSFDWVYTENETCLIIEGKATVTDGTDSVDFGPGDMVSFPKELECTWHVKEAITKHYNFS